MNADRRRLALWALAAAAFLSTAIAHAHDDRPSGFDADFTGATMRADLIHVGTAGEEHWVVDRLRVEGPWPGSRTRLLDTTNLGKYLLELAETESGRVLYSRGFASIFGEWETTGEATREWGAIQEALRFPEPRRPAQLRVRKRDGRGVFAEIWTHALDPASRFVDRPPLPHADVVVLQEHGDPAVKVDLLILGDGYTASRMSAFDAAARRAAEALFAEEPFRSRRTDFNVRAIRTPAAHRGISRPRAGVFRDSPLGARYNSFDSERYVLTMRDRAWRDVAAAAPYDAVLILVDERKYGGGGIFNLYSTAAAESAFADYLVVHEFGHHFAALGDEYYTSPVAYDDAPGAASEPWERNITALGDPAALKWRELVEPGVPLPTPWDKQRYDRVSRELQARRAELRAAGADEAELEALFREERATMTELLGGEEHAGRVGAFEGAMYRARGLFRPAVDCLMFTRNDVGFCPVCRREIERVIDLHTR